MLERHDLRNKVQRKIIENGENMKIDAFQSTVVQDSFPVKYLLILKDFFINCSQRYLQLHLQILAPHLNYFVLGRDLNIEVLEQNFVNRRKKRKLSRFTTLNCDVDSSQ